MWEEKEDESKNSDEDESICSTGIRWQFKDESQLKEGEFLDGIFQLDSSMLTEEQKVEFELHYDFDCPEIYTSQLSLVEMEIEIEPADLYEKIEF